MKTEIIEIGDVVEFFKPFNFDDKKENVIIARYAFICGIVNKDTYCAIPFDENGKMIFNVYGSKKVPTRRDCSLKTFKLIQKHNLPDLFEQE